MNFDVLFPVMYILAAAGFIFSHQVDEFASYRPARRDCR